MPFDPQRIRERRLKASEGFLDLKMPDHALRELESIDDPGDHLFSQCMLRGEAWLLKLDHHQALDAYREAHFTNPTDLNALLRIAWCLKRVDQLSLAIDTMRLAYELHKSAPVVLYNMACYYALAGDKENALSWLGRSLRMDRHFLDKIADESDFDSLRNDPDFQYLLELTSSQNS